MVEHYNLDGIRAWRDGKYFPFLFKNTVINAQYKDVLTINLQR